MKQAQLPDGTILEFPDDTADEVIDRTVKQALGISEEIDPVSAGTVKPFEGDLDPVPETPDYQRINSEARVAGLEVSAAQVEAALSGVQTLTAIAEKIDTLSQTVMALAQKDDATLIASRVEAMTESMIDSNTEAAQTSIEIANAMMQKIDNLAQVTVQASQNVVAAYTAPRVLTRGADNKTATLEVRP